MAYVFIEHEISHWRTFEEIFRRDGERREELGSRGAIVIRYINNPQKVLIIFEWNTIEGALKFADSLEAHEAASWAASDTKIRRLDVGEELLNLDA
ncbi:MAG: hypothetical protein ACOX8V_01270 [Thermoleophilia bacterium]|jgi:hypothetical protein